MSESVVLQPAFEIENTVLHNICAISNFQLTIAAKPAALTYAVQMAIRFRDREHHRGATLPSKLQRPLENSYKPSAVNKRDER